MNLATIGENDLTLIDPRLKLSPVHVEDATDTYLSWLNDVEINKFLETRWTAQTHESNLAHIKKIRNSLTEVLLKLVVLKDSTHIGNIKIGPIDVNNKSVELSYFIGAKSYWGQGYATEAINLCVNFVLKLLAYTRFRPSVTRKTLEAKKFS